MCRSRTTKLLLACTLLVVIPVRGEDKKPESPAPAASPAVQALIDESSRLLKGDPEKDPKIAPRPEDALLKADSALAMAKELREGAGIALSLVQRARSLQGLKKTNEALAAWEEARAEWELLGDGPGQVEAHCAQALVLSLTDDPRAGTHVGQAIALAKMETKRPLAAAAILQRASVRLWTVSKLDLAKPLAEEGLAIRERLNPGSAEVAGSQASLANIAFRQDDLATARELFQRALEFHEKASPGSPNEAASLGYVGVVALEQGDLAAAREVDERSLKIWEDVAPDSPNVGVSLNNLGLVLLRQGDLAGARDLLQHALQVMEKQDPDPVDIAQIINNIGMAAHEQGDLPAARELFQRAIQTLEEHDKSVQGPAFINNLGLVAKDQGDLATARTLIQQALKIWGEEESDSMGITPSLLTLGQVAQGQGNLEEARALFQRALRIRHQKAPGSVDEAETLGALGLLASVQGQTGQAAESLAQAWTIVRQQRSAISGSDAQLAFGREYGEIGLGLAAAQVKMNRATLASQTIEEGRVLSIYELAVERAATLGKASAILKNAFHMSDATMNRAGEKLAAAEVDLQKAVETVSNLKKSKRANATEMADLEKAKADAKAKRDRAFSDYTRAGLERGRALKKLKEAVTGLSAAPPPVSESRKSLPTGSLYAAFSVGEKETLLFLIPADTVAPIQALSVPFGEKALADRVARLRGGLTRDAASRGRKEPGAEPNPPTEIDFARESLSLFRDLFPEKVRQKVLSAPRLVLSPDGPLWAFPFAALATADGPAPRWLGLSRPISYAWSLGAFATDSKRPRSIPAGPRQALVVGDPVFSKGPAAPQVASVRGERGLFVRDGQVPPRLRWTRGEAEAIADLWGTSPLLGEAATEAAVRSRLEAAPIVHLATHGYLLPQRAMSSGLLLAATTLERVGDTDDDGVLQAWEIQSELKLSAEMVVLSACETGLGETTRGEGVVGMTRSVLTSGAKSVVATQWRVSDERTKGLMVRFHEGLKRGLPKDEALREAQVSTASDPESGHPYWWAGVFLMGDPAGTAPR